jgi:hypothetical protein
MNYSGNFIQSVLASWILLIACAGAAQDTSNLPYMNPKLSPEERATDLVHRMTLEERASQLAVNRRRSAGYRRSRRQWKPRGEGPNCVAGVAGMPSMPESFLCLWEARASIRTLSYYPAIRRN